jgi:hypothetical protein
VLTTNLIKNGTIFSYAVAGSSTDANEVVIFNTRNLQPVVANLFATTNGTSVNDGSWHHLAMSWTNSGEMRFYRDGTLVMGINDFRTGTLLRDFGSLILGQDQDNLGGGFDSNQALEGQLDEVRIWSIARSQETIQSNKHISLSGAEPNLVAYYRFDEAGGLTATNSATNINHGQLNGSTTNRVVSSAPVGLPPVITASHTGVWPVAVTLRAAINPNGSDTAWWFEWGPGTNLVNTTATGLVTAAYTTSLLSRIVATLPDGTSITYRLCASNVIGVICSPEYAFTTPTNFVVATTNDHVPGSLREAIAFARSNEVISFSVAGTFPILTQHITIAQSLTLRGDGPAHQILVAPASRHFLVASNHMVNLEGLTLADGSLDEDVPSNLDDKSGGAILNYGTLALTNCILRNNRIAPGNEFYDGLSGRGGLGGAIFSRGILTLDRCAFYLNQAGDAASPFASSTGQPGGSGGAIHAVTTLTARACVFIGNRAGNGAYTPNEGFSTGTGGAGGHGGAIFASGPVYLENCTLADNEAGTGGGGVTFGGGPGNSGSGGAGGAISTTGSVTLVHCTLSLNRGGKRGTPGNGGAGGTGGAIHENGSASVSMINTLVSSNRVFDGATGPDIRGDITSLGHNLLGIVEGSAGLTNGILNDQAGSAATPLDALLGAPVYSTNAIAGYLAPGPGSSAFESGDDAVLGPPYSLATDVRGFARKSGTRVDIGSYETDAATFLPPSIQPVGVTNVTTHPAGATDAFLGGAVTVGTLPSFAFIEYGLNTAYGQRTPSFPTQGTNTLSFASLVPGLLGGYTYHFRIVVSNATDIFYGPDQTYTPPAVVLPGDLDGDGIIAQEELDAILPNYWINSPYLEITNVVGAGTSNVVFSLPNPGAWAFTVEVSTNLNTWNPAGDANPAYLFLDNTVSNAGTRYYRLVWP